jgi:hypothetical protein
LIDSFKKKYSHVDVICEYNSFNRENKSNVQNKNRSEYGIKEVEFDYIKPPEKNHAT